MSGCLASHAVYDIAVIGGGINGAGIAADAAGRGLKVLLCEKDDFAAHTSSASSKLIHGGLRYLEQYDLQLVRKALIEREVLLNKAPHLVLPLKFILPQQSALRAPWLIRLGLFCYDHLYWHNTLPRSEAIKLDAHSPLHSRFTQAFSYYDCRVDDARLVLANIKAAAHAGASIWPRTECVALKPAGEFWQLTLKTAEQQAFHVTAKTVVNSTGAWAAQFSAQTARLPAQPLRWVKGSHIVVAKLYEEDTAYILQNADRRVVFALPYQRHFTLIGTTDVDYQGDLNQPSLSPEEAEYLLASSNAYFKKHLTCADICHSFSGIRALWQVTGQAAQASRDYQLRLESTTPALLSVYGGKLTTYRLLAEQALEMLKEALPQMGAAWTKSSLLPGAKTQQSAHSLAQALLNHHPWLCEPLALRLCASYGTDAWTLIGSCQRLEDLGEAFGHSLYRQEVDYMCEHEWAQTAEDILWRRSQLGLWFSPAQTARLSQYLASR